MKKHLMIFTVLFASIAYGQQGRVGINTTTPNATLDVTASPTDLTRIDGFIAPRLTRDQVKAKDSNYTNDQTGAIVYATAPANPTIAKTINVTSAGYYYFDGTVWVKVTDTKNYVEPWNIAGTINPATSNTQDIYQTGKVGIGNNNPTQALDIKTGGTPAAPVTGLKLVDGNQRKGYVNVLFKIGLPINSIKS